MARFGRAAEGAEAGLFRKAATWFRGSHVEAEAPVVEPKLSLADSVDTRTVAGRLPDHLYYGQFKTKEIFGDEAGIHRAFRVEVEGKPIGVYKPTFNRYLKVERERAAWAADEEMGMGVVPHTKAWHGPMGPGSLQKYVESTGRYDGASELGNQKMAVLDYVTGNADRNPGNCLKALDEEPAAIDNERMFMDTDNLRTDDRIRSDFVVNHLGQDLDPDLVARLKAVDIGQFRDRLLAEGIPATAVDNSVRRLMEIRDNGKILGTEWGKTITDGYDIIRHPPHLAGTAWK